MNKKRILVSLAMVAALCLLVYLQVRTWSKFNWHTFWINSEHVDLLGIAAGVAITYITYILRAVRWRIFLKPVSKTASTRSLLAPQFIGFAALALLGRAGEVVRPYIIAKKEHLTFASQMAVWTVERIFDIGAFAIMLLVTIFYSDLSVLPPRLNHGLHEAAFVLIFLVAGLVVMCVVIRVAGEAVAEWLHRRFVGFAPRLANQLRDKVKDFSVGLETIQDVGSAVQLIAISIVMWGLIAISYLVITHAYPGELRGLTMPMMIVLMGSSMVGSMLQLPAVGGGSQLATISMLSSGFGIEHELAVSCGILIWAITFMSVVPSGLLLARREHLSIREVAKEERVEEARKS
jgi:glycosyltransferase 2 family protein